MSTTWKSYIEPMIGLLALALIVVGLGFLIVQEPQRIAAAQDQLLATQLDEAMTLYAENCAICHGASGEGIGASPALDQETVRQIPYEELVKVIARGRYNTAMPAWSEAEGGVLSDYQISELVALIQAGDWQATKERVDSLGLTPKVPFTAQPDAEKLAEVANLPNGEVLSQAITLYAENCIACHGADGLGTSLAPALQDPAVAQKDAETLRRTIALGVPGTVMSGWQNVLNESEISALVTLIQEWDQLPAGVLPEPPIQVDLSAANLAQGEQLYAANCSRCHGPEGQGTPRGPALNVKSFLTETSDGAIQQIIRNGVPGTAMIGWGDRLTEEEILSLVAYLRNWEATAPEVATPVRMGGGGPPWLRTTGSQGPSQAAGQPRQEMGQAISSDLPSSKDSQVSQQSLIQKILGNWKTLLLAVGVLAFAFFFIFNALNGIRPGPS